MSMFGVLLLIAILTVFAFILLADTIQEKIQSVASLPEPTRLKIQEICQHVSNPTIKEQASYVALLFGIWNLFGPNFGSLYGGLPIIGALIPSLILCFDAFILNPELLNWGPILSIRNQIQTHIEQYSPIAGWATLGVAVLHSLFFRWPFF